jgi:prefoldin beta subunit
MEEDKNQEIQFLEQHIQGILYQKQTLEIELVEVEAALKELEKSGEEVYKIIGQMMLKSDKGEMKKELGEKKDKANSNLKLLQEQEDSLKQSLDKLKK